MKLLTKLLLLGIAVSSTSPAGATFVAATTRRAVVNVESISVDITPIPEPGSAGLLLLGVAYLTATRRSRPVTR